jgi:hypothetical protein
MEQTLIPFLKRLLTGTRLTDEEQRALLALGGILERVKAGRTIVPLGENTVSTCLILEGLCTRIELPILGRRQITAFYIRGDLPDLYTAFNPRAISAIETITPAAIIRLRHAAPTQAYPDVSRYRRGVHQMFVDGCRHFKQVDSERGRT